MKDEIVYLRNQGRPYAEIASIVGTSEANARMIYSREQKRQPGESAKRANIAPKLRQNPDATIRESMTVQKSVVKKSLTTQPLNLRRFALYGLLIAPTAASVQNAFHVSAQIMGDTFGAACLTVVLSVTALGFVAIGARNWYTFAIAAVLVAYESFCNLTRIYSGLMDGGKYGTSEFLGRVCDVFAFGSHYTAVALAALTAVLLAGVQYASLFELSKK